MQFQGLHITICLFFCVFNLTSTKHFAVSRTLLQMVKNQQIRRGFWKVFFKHSGEIDAWLRGSVCGWLREWLWYRVLVEKTAGRASKVLKSHFSTCSDDDIFVSILSPSVVCSLCLFPSSACGLMTHYYCFFYVCVCVYAVILHVQVYVLVSDGRTFYLLKSNK